MIRAFFLIVVCVIGVSCHQKLLQYSKTRNKLTAYQHINDSTLSISGVSMDQEFGRTESKPIMVGIFDVHEGANNVGKYLNALLGPMGEQIHYTRLKPCCPFRTKNFTYRLRMPINGVTDFDGKYGMLEKYRVEYSSPDGIKSCVLFFDLYDETHDLLAPYGFRFKAP